MNRLMLICLLTILLIANTTSAQEKNPGAAARIAKAANKISQNQNYRLAYKLKKGDVVSMSVEQVVSTKFQMAGELEESSSRSASTKSWKVMDVDSLGNITFALSLDAIDMWQKVGESEPVKFNSKSDKEIPDEYKQIASHVGKTLAIFSITPYGKILDRKSALPEGSFGAGKITVPLPNQPVPIGYQWNVPTILEATDSSGSNKKLKARIQYTLEKVREGNAYIKFKTEVLTPVTSQKIKSTIMQKLTKGYVVFDINQGRLLMKKVEWDEKAQGFEGPDSFLQYIGRMTEKLTTPVQVGSKDQSSANDAAADKPLSDLRTADQKPKLRK